MFDNFKKLAELKRIQDNLKNEEATVEKRGVSVRMNGNFDVKDIKLNPDLGIEDQAIAVVEAVNEANKVIKEKMAKSLGAQFLN